MNENEIVTIHLGDAIHSDIDHNEYLREIHDNLLYNDQYGELPPCHLCRRYCAEGKAQYLADSSFL